MLRGNLLNRTQVTCKSIIEDSEVQKISSNGVNNSSVVNSAIDKYKKIDPSYEYITGNLFQCHKCAEAFENVPSFSEHWKHVHALKVIHCRCKLIFPSLEQQRTHEKEIHNFVCCVCNIRFVSGFALEDHLLTSHLCDYTGKIINSLDSTKIQCEHCEDWFCFRQQLQMHVKLKHSKRSDTNNDSKALKSSIVPVDSSEDPEKPKPLKTCKVCGVIVSNKKERQTHYRLHKLATVTSKGGEAESNRIEGTHGEYSKEVAEENVNAVADGQHASDVADGQSMNEFADGQNLRKFANGENPNFADDDYTNGNVDGQNANFAVDEYGNDVVDGENANFADDEYANDVVGGENANFADDEYTNDVVDGENADEFADEEYVNDVYDEEYTNEVYDEEYTNEVYDEEYANEVEDDFTNEVDEVYVSEFADEENQNEVVDEETRTKIADEETRTKIADEETRTKIADEETRTKIADEENPAKIADEETPPKIVDEETRTKIADEENPAKIADEETPTKIADEENSANC
ncbi:unnamed protein product [Allacma fusca]|uniref:C2H2-type domain-containing protein n=1 Tax=Allacma fusca TaxID=39272 RepID=A0A8J2L5L6_9HEXA|nr:unnamed protein product [Allacma fusca]